MYLFAVLWFALGILITFHFVPELLGPKSFKFKLKLNNNETITEVNFNSIAVTRYLILYLTYYSIQYHILFI